MSPFADYKDFADCVAKTRRAHPDWSTERCEHYCGAIKHRTEDQPRGRPDARRRQHGR